jgi:hypothetical protein
MRPAAQEITREDLTMEHFGPLLERNRHFATTNAGGRAHARRRHGDARMSTPGPRPPAREDS